MYPDSHDNSLKADAKSSKDSGESHSGNTAPGHFPLASNILFSGNQYSSNSTYAPNTGSELLQLLVSSAAKKAKPSKAVDIFSILQPSATEKISPTTKSERDRRRKLSQLLLAGDTQPKASVKEDSPILQKVFGTYWNDDQKKESENKLPFGIRADKSGDEGVIGKVAIDEEEEQTVSKIDMLNVNEVETENKDGNEEQEIQSVEESAPEQQKVNKANMSNKKDRSSVGGRPDEIIKASSSVSPEESEDKLNPKDQQLKDTTDLNPEVEDPESKYRPTSAKFTYRNPFDILDEIDALVPTKPRDEIKLNVPTKASSSPTVGSSQTKQTAKNGKSNSPDRSKSRSPSNPYKNKMAIPLVASDPLFSNAVESDQEAKDLPTQNTDGKLSTLPTSANQLQGSEAKRNGQSTSSEKIEISTFLPYLPSFPATLWLEKKSESEFIGYRFKNFNGEPRIISYDISSPNEKSLFKSSVQNAEITLVAAEYSFWQDSTAKNGRFNMQTIDINEEYIAYAYNGKGPRVRVISQSSGANVLIKPDVVLNSVSSQILDLSVSCSAVSMICGDLVAISLGDSITIFKIKQFPTKSSLTSEVFKVIKVKGKKDQSLTVRHVKIRNSHSPLLLATMTVDNVGWCILLSINELEPSTDINVCSSPKGRGIFAFRAHEKVINDIKLVPGTSNILTSSDDGFVKLWEFNIDTAVAKLMGSIIPCPDEAVTSIETLKISKAGLTILVGSKWDSVLQLITISSVKGANVHDRFEFVNRSDTSRIPLTSSKNFISENSIILLSSYDRMSFFSIQVNLSSEEPKFLYLAEFATETPILNFISKSVGEHIVIYAAEAAKFNRFRLPILMTCPESSMKKCTLLPCDVYESPSLKYVTAIENPSPDAEFKQLPIPASPEREIAEVNGEKEEGSPASSTTDDNGATKQSKKNRRKRKNGMGKAVEKSEGSESEKKIIILQNDNLKQKSPAVNTESKDASASQAKPTSAIVTKEEKKAGSQAVTKVKSSSSSSSPSATPSKVQTQYQPLTTKLSEKDMNQIKYHIDTTMKNLYTKLEKERLDREALENSRQEHLLKVVSLTLTKNVGDYLESVISKEIQKNVLPKLEKSLAQNLNVSSDLKDEINKVIPSTVQTCVTRTLNQHQVLNDMTSAVAKAMKPSVELAFQNCFVNTVIPSYQKATGVMFQQIATSFETGLLEFRPDLTQSQTLLLEQQQTIQQLTVTVNSLTKSVVEMKDFIAQQNEQTNRLLSTIAHNMAKIETEQKGQDKLANSPTADRSPPAKNKKVEVTADKFSQQSVTPKKSSKPTPTDLTKASVLELLAQGLYEVAFTQVLSTGDSSYLSWLVEQKCPSVIFSDQNVLLSQPVILSLIHQLSINMELSESFQLRTKWISECLKYLNPKDVQIYQYCGKFLPGISARLLELWQKASRDPEYQTQLEDLQNAIRLIRSMSFS